MTVLCVGAFGSVDSLDKLGGEVWSSSGISFLTAPEWSSEQVAQWLQRVGLGKHSEGATEKGFSGKQLIELDSGRIKVSYSVYVVQRVVRARAG